MVWGRLVVLALGLQLGAYAQTVRADSAKVAVETSDVLKDFFKLIADPKSTVDDIKASLAVHPVGLDAVYGQWTPTLYALRYRKMDIFNYFYDRMGSPSVNETIDGTYTSIFSTAVQYADWATIQTLRQKGGKSKSKQDEFVMAARANSVDVLQQYLTNGALINAKDSSGDIALIQAAQWNSKEAMAALLKAGANIKLTNKYGWTPLLALASGKPDLDKYTLLIQAGANIHDHALDKESLLVMASGWWPKEFLQTLIQAGLDLNEAGKTTTALLQAAQKNTTDVVALLLANGAKVRVTDEDLNTVLHEAAFNGKCSPETYTLLINAGAGVEAKNKYGSTPLMHAAGFSCAAVVRLLIEAGAKVNEVDQFGEGPLYQAAYWARYYDSRVEVIQELISAGANLNLKNSDGKTPYDVALELGAPQEVQDLLKPH